jgi:hypothetical protein
MAFGFRTLANNIWRDVGISWKHVGFNDITNYIWGNWTKWPNPAMSRVSSQGIVVIVIYSETMLMKGMIMTTNPKQHCF